MNSDTRTQCGAPRAAAPPCHSLSGQALVEYAMILALLIVGLIIILAAIVPAISNIVSETVYVLLDAQAPRPTMTPAQFASTLDRMGTISSGTAPAYHTWTPTGGGG